ncbi:MAG: Fe-S cluster assembly protein SufD [Bradymonadia bacterium]|jgi:Fe-S cluster assembly protein SufD
MSLIDSYRDAAAPLLTADQPEWLKSRREAALDQFASLGFPTRKDEEWKYTQVRGLSKSVFGIPEGGGDAAAIIAATKLSDVCATLVYVNGRFDEEASSTDALPEGVTIVRGEAAHDHIQSAQPLVEENGLDALRKAFVTDAIAIEVAANAVMNTPIHIVRVGTTSGWMAAQQTVIRVGKSAVGFIVESFAGEAGAEYFHNLSTDAAIGVNAELKHIRVQAEGNAAWHYAVHDVQVERDARYTSFCFSTGAKTSRETVNVQVNGSGVHSDVASIFAPGDGQCHDSHTLIDHHAPNCTADQLYKGILHGSGHGIFNGKVYVQQAAQQTNANQMNQNLMLSRDSRIDTKPQLEIFADDVRCTHGATVGQLEPEELFYMMSRALPAATARRIIIRGFAEDALQRVTHEPTAARMRALLDVQLD